jgi:hypothetical protein
LRRVLRRFAGRAVTGPGAFLLAGIIDLLVFGAAALRHWIVRRRRSARRRAV